MPSPTLFASAKLKSDAATCLLDKSALLAHFRNETGAAQVTAVFDEPDAGLLVASVTLTEFARRWLALGFSVQEAQKATAAYRLLLNDVVAIDEHIATVAFELGCQTPIRLPMVDALIAAAASARSAVLLHRDPHLAAIPPARLAQRNLGV